jgi:hypothetical protein
VNHSIFAVSSLTVSNSTISGNTARSGGGLINRASSYYGIPYFGYSKVTLNRTLISGNKADYDSQISNNDDFTADNFNLFGSDGDPGVTGFTPGLTDIVPAPGVRVGNIIGLLRNNGGPTQTHALKRGSPALDVIPSTDASCTGKDQRGVDRPQGIGCDIGAFER